MTPAIILLNFGEPSEATPEAVIPFLERIFTNNASLEALQNPEAVRQRSRMLAERRAPSLIADYKRIGGSPLVTQAARQAAALEAELARRAHPARVYVAYQFIEPLIDQVVATAWADGATEIVGFPYYPLCGFSTNVAAVQHLRAAVDQLGVDLPVHALTGWHHHPSFTLLWAEQIQRYVAEQALSLDEAGTHLYFSAHGTPIKYLEAGSRYDRYVAECCRAIADHLGVATYSLGYQNHSNRGIAWTQPDNEDLIRTIEAERLVVVPISFMREQSETLSELDLDFRDTVAERGMRLYRVPVPHDAPRLTTLVADLLMPFLTQQGPLDAGLARCRCASGAFCTNGDRNV